MLQRDTILKTAFYFRTRKEFESVQEHVKDINAKYCERVFYRTQILHVYTRYLSTTWMLTIPLAKPGRKKYLGIVEGNNHKLQKHGIKPKRFLQHLGVELVPTETKQSKYDGPKTTYATTLKTYDELKTITSVFNKRFGHGNWRIQGPKRLQNLLRKISPQPDTPTSPFIIRFDGAWPRELAKYPNGVPVTFIANEADADIPKLLFKAVLKG